MKAGLHFPSSDQLNHFLIHKQKLAPQYPEKLDTQADFSVKRQSDLGKKYNYDENQILLGHGPEVFARAKSALRHWEMFPHWTRLYPKDTPIEPGRAVAVLFRLLGIWWWNASEIQYAVDQPGRFGFAYGTLPGHVESGEELFLVEMDTSGKVWYKIKAFSRPAYWFVSLAYPFARSQQKRFVRDSMRQMKAVIDKPE